MAYWVREFRNTRTGKRFRVASDEAYLPPLRRRIVGEYGGDIDWENESVYEHQQLDMKLDGGHRNIAVDEID